MWAFHGGKDPVVPLEESQRMVDALKKAGVQDVKLTVYPEAGHDSWTETYKNPELYEWLLKHERREEGLQCLRTPARWRPSPAARPFCATLRALAAPSARTLWT